MQRTEKSEQSLQTINNKAREDEKIINTIII